ncbi:hypothetical protein NMY22_g1578 [Coprinellus aureogranulatus]|nr:hypothetical protein NMY22_g1578 [Coprinellus aureogranulatus]
MHTARGALRKLKPATSMVTAKSIDREEDVPGTIAHANCMHIRRPHCKANNLDCAFDVYWESEIWNANLFLSPLFTFHPAAAVKPVSGRKFDDVTKG